MANPGHGSTACVALLHSSACVSGYLQILLVIWYAFMHSQPGVQQWTDQFPFEMIVITVSGDGVCSIVRRFDLLYRLGSGLWLGPVLVLVESSDYRTFGLSIQNPGDRT